MGNARDAVEESRLSRKGEKAKVWAPRRRPSSWRRRKGRPWESIWGCSAVKEALSNQFQGKPVQFPGALGLDILFSSFLYSSDTRRTCILWVSRAQGPIYSFDPCRLGQIPGVLRERFESFELFVDPNAEVAPVGGCFTFVRSMQTGFLKLPSRQCSESRVLEYLLRFHSLPPKRVPGVPVFQVSPVIKNIGHCQATIPRGHWWHAVRACGAGLLADGCKRIWMCARRAARGGCGSSIARGSFETCSPRSSRNGTSTSLPKRWCCAACEPCRGSGDCRCGSRQKISILSVSHALGRVHFEREFHKELIPNCMESCVVSWSVFIKSGRRLPSGQSWRYAQGGSAQWRRSLSR